MPLLHPSTTNRKYDPVPCPATILHAKTSAAVSCKWRDIKNTAHPPNNPVRDEGRAFPLSPAPKGLNGAPWEQKAAHLID